jgi:2-polyprenyl-3-methyl-5-hydroxy-6-metoxy-1,4-benzoquinol methylase
MQDSGLKLNEYKNLMFRTITRRLRESKAGSRLLDIGASYGGFGLVARQQGFEVECTDIVPAAIGYLKSQGFQAYSCYSVAELPAGKKYDVITAIDCNFYWPRQYDEVTAIRERLADNGLFVIRTASKSWLVSLGLFIRNFSKPTGEKIISRALNDHRHSMPPESLAKLVQSQGFEHDYTSIADAMHSENASAGVKLSFHLGTVLYKLFGVYLSPGVLFFFRKRS